MNNKEPDIFIFDNIFEDYASKCEYELGEFADKIETEQVLIPHGGHINSESRYDTFEDIVSCL